MMEMEVMEVYVVEVLQAGQSVVKVSLIRKLRRDLVWKYKNAQAIPEINLTMKCNKSISTLQMKAAEDSLMLENNKSKLGLP
jgi:hypothetical protein